MPSLKTICSFLLLSVLWLDLAMAGSSFLSPEHQRIQQRKESKKPPAKLQPRALESWLHSEDGGQAEGAEDELEIQVGTSAVLCFFGSKGAGVRGKGGQGEVAVNKVQLQAHQDYKMAPQELSSALGSMRSLPIKRKRPGRSNFAKTE
nr:appetite-regulating hormone isoform X1 [Aotus nancymaae]